MYKEIAEQAITTSTKTIELMKWLILSVIGVSTGIVGYIFKALKDTDEQTKKLREELLVSVNKLGEAQKQFEAMTSHFNLLQHELIDQTSVFVSQEFAIDAFEKGKITEKQLIESQIWFTWSKWRYSDSNEGYQELVGCKESNGLPDSIRRVAIIELDNLQHAVKTRGIITTHEKDLRLKLLDLLDFVPLTNL